MLPAKPLRLACHRRRGTGNRGLPPIGIARMGDPSSSTVDLQLTCDCGTVRGLALSVTPANVTRLVCMCDDCQAYAHHLQRADRVLDQHGGTEVFQTVPARLRLSSGLDHIGCVQLTPNGLMRWYARCCQTPLANTMRSPKVPFVGVHAAFIGADTDRDSTLGPVRCYTQGRFGLRPLPPTARQRASLSIIIRSVRQLLAGWVRGHASPHPFFVGDTRNPIATPQVLPSSVRERLRPLCGPDPTIPG